MPNDKIREISEIAEEILDDAEKADAVCQAVCRTLEEDGGALSDPAARSVATRQAQAVSDFLFNVLEDVWLLQQAVKALRGTAAQAEV